MKVILINEKDLNSRGNGTQTTHQVALASANWATWHWLDAAPCVENVDGSLSGRGTQQKVTLDLEPGDLIREYRSSLRGHQKQGRADCNVYIFTGERSESGLLPENATKIGEARWNWEPVPNAEAAAAKAARKWLDARAERARRAEDPIYAAEDAAADALAAAEKEGEALWRTAEKAEGDRGRAACVVSGGGQGAAVTILDHCTAAAATAADALGGYLPRLERLRDEAERTAAAAKAHTAALKKAERKAAKAEAAAIAPVPAPAPVAMPAPAAPVVVLAPVAVSIAEVRERIARLERELAEARGLLAGLEGQAAAAYDAAQPDPRAQ